MVRKILGNFGVRLLSAIMNLMIAIVVSQYIGATGKGEQSLVLTMIAIVTIFDNMVGGASIVYLTNKLRIRSCFSPLTFGRFSSVLRAISFYFMWN